MSMDEQAGRRKPELFEVVRGFEDLNLVEFPLALLDKRAPTDLRTLKFEDQIKDSSTGELVNRRVTVSAVDELCLPTWGDMDILLVLMALWRERTGFESETLRFSIYDVCKHAGLDMCGKSYARVKTALEVWNATWIRLENARWIPGEGGNRKGGKWESNKGFHIISLYELTNCSDDFDAKREQYLDFNKVVVENARSEWIKKFDLEFYLSLKLPSTKRLYRLLDKRLYGERTTYSVKLLPFCREKIGFSRGYAKPSKYKQVIQPAIDELVSRKFLRDVPKDKLFTGRSSDYQVHFHRAKGRTVSGAKPERRMVLSASEAKLEERLVGIGIQRGTGPTDARTLVTKLDNELLGANVERFETLKANGGDVTPGLLVSMTKQGQFIRLPEGVKSKSERAEERARKEKRLAVERLAEQRRVQALEAERAASKRQAEVVRRALAGKSEAEVEELLEAAYAAGADEVKRHFDNCRRMKVGLEDARNELLFGFLERC